MSDALFSDCMISASPVSASLPVQSASKPSIRPADLPGLLAVGMLGAVIMATSLLAIGFCFVSG